MSEEQETKKSWLEIQLRELKIADRSYQNGIERMRLGDEKETLGYLPYSDMIKDITERLKSFKKIK